MSVIATTLVVCLIEKLGLFVEKIIRTGWQKMSHCAARKIASCASTCKERDSTTRVVNIGAKILLAGQ